MEKWHIEKAAGRCARSGVEIAEGEPYYAVLYEEGEGFRREEYSLAAWEGTPAGAYCFFKTQMPVKAKKKRLLVDDEVLVAFFKRLADETQIVRLQFRFVLALILMRKRLLRYEETVREEDREIWVMRLVKESQLHRVANPRLNDDEIESVSRELGAVLHGDMGRFDDLNDEDGAETEAAGID